jgi:AraC-like DNA-binding protein
MHYQDVLMNNHIHTDKASVTSADELEAVLKAIAGPIRITPKYANRFNADLSASRLRRIGMALLDLGPLHSLIEPQHNFYCLSVPIVNACSIKDAFSRREFTRNTAHLLYPDRMLDCLHKEKCKLLGVTFMIDNLDDIAVKLLGNTNALKPLNDCSLSLTTPAGTNLVHKLTHACGVTNQNSTALDSELTSKELEDDLITALLIAMEESQYDTERLTTGRTGNTQIANAEDYLFSNLTNPVSRAELAEVAGVSIRSLSRAFMRRHGVGPMKFLKQRRMEAVRMELINAQPENTKISDVALRYGFTELGKFSLLYRSIYNEKPSETLKH